MTTSPSPLITLAERLERLPSFLRASGSEPYGLWCNMPADMDLLRQASLALRRAAEEQQELTAALIGMLAEWDKFTRYGSPLAKAANENVSRARLALSRTTKGASDA